MKVLYYSLVLHALYNKSMIENLSKKVSELFLLFLNLYHIKVHVIFVCFDFTFTLYCLVYFLLNLWIGNIVTV